VTLGDSDSDETLAARAAQGDRMAFERIVQRHKTQLFQFVRRYVGQSDDAYDVLQDTFLAAWSAAPRYDPSRSFSPWLRTIALNKCRDFGRRQAVRRLLLRARAAEPNHVPGEWDITDDQANAEANRLNRLDKAIAALPAFYKEPLLLTSVSGLSHQEAAETLKTTAKAVEMRVYRARRKLFAALGSDEEG